MNRLMKLFLGLLIATSILVVTYPAVASRSNADSEKNGFGLEISLEGRQPFTLAVSGKNERIAVLPLKEAKASAIKVIPWVDNGSLKLKLLAVLDELPEVPTCDNIKGLKTEVVASFAVGAGDVVRVSDFQKFGVTPFTVKAISLLAAQTVCPEGGCCCGTVTCYPNPGHCIQCGSCGLCCKSGGGGDN
jgi:hypothetical protein